MAVMVAVVVVEGCISVSIITTTTKTSVSFGENNDDERYDTLYP